jgi:FkbM family methyltransferase
MTLPRRLPRVRTGDHGQHPRDAANRNRTRHRECRQLIRDGVFFDIGANIGRVFRSPHAKRIVAIEPDPKTFAELSTRLGDCASVEALAGPEGGERTFLFNTIASSSSTSVAQGDEPSGHDELVRSTMRAIRLDRLAHEHGQPDLIKIDVDANSPCSNRERTCWQNSAWS